MASPNQAAGIPVWVNEDHIIDVLAENVEGFKSINKFETSLAGGVGENYSSVLVRVKVSADLIDGSTKNEGFIIKSVPQTEMGAMMTAMMGVFPKENLMYGKYLPTFEKMYRDAGKHVSFGPKCYTLKNSPGSDYVLLDDLCPQGYHNENRIQGLDKKHTEAVLKILAELHAASAVLYENVGGELETPLVAGIFNEQTAGMFAAMIKPTLEIFLKCMAKNEVGARYLEKGRALVDENIDTFIELSKPDPEGFNVICHGDLWSNNVMFKHNDQGEIEDTKLIDFQMSRYASPVIDLFYFLLTSPKLEIKVANFDDFIKYYHDNLIENLKLLNYSKKLPTLKELQMALLKKSSFGFSTLTNTCAGILLDPSECGSVEDFFKEGDAAEKMKARLYENPRYVKHMEVILTWMGSRGFLDL